MSEIPDRPAPPRSAVDRVRSWVQWVGAGRLVGSAVVVVAVLAAAYWLVKPPAATTESKLPFATSATSPPEATAVPTASNSSPTSVLPAGVVVVHVAGAVQVPGVYRLPEGSRVDDAVQAASGLSAGADTDAINLAALLSDGQRVFVPRVGEAIPIVVAGGAAPPGVTSEPPGPVNINSATAADLDLLPGVGPATAAAILAYRELHGPFTSTEQLGDVRGIGPAKLAALRGLVTI